jgi:valyl-tRNA synthetase
VRDGQIAFYPERWSKVYLHWLENIQDWCISRQLWWGHRIPVWYRKGLDRDRLSPDELRDPTKVHVSPAGPGDPENWEQEEDVLDTWASSWLWPFVTLGWPDAAAMDKQGFDYFYPTTTLVTGPDIIFFWVARMIMAGLEFTRPGEPLERRIPFRNVYFTGIIRDAQGRKMSKSLGNSPDPIELIGKYGADGLRFGIISIAPQGQDIRFQEERIEGGKNFCNKLWNACRFRQMSGPAGAKLEFGHFDADDHAILHRLVRVTAELERCFREFEFSAAVQALYTFFWNDFCDWYVEVSKAKLANEATRGNCLAVQDFVLRQTLLQLHPFIPFITEELWKQLGFGAEGMLLMRDGRVQTAAQLEAGLREAGIVIDQTSADSIEAVKAFVSQARALKAERGLGSRRDVKFVAAAGEAAWATLQAHHAKLLRMAGATAIDRGEGSDAMPAAVTPLGVLRMDASAAIDLGAERARLTKEREKLAQHVAGTQARLGNSSFVDKAPPAVLEGARRQLADLQTKLAETDRLLQNLK